MEQRNVQPTTNPTIMAMLVEGGLIAAALFLGWLGFSDRSQSLAEWPANWPRLILFGALATVPMLLYLALYHFWTGWTFIRPMRQVIDSKLRPLFVNSSIFELLVISILAGVGEELFFRWCLQGGMAHVLQPSLGSSASLVAGLAVASFLFGGCHWVNASYGIVTILVGAYLGLTMIWSGSWLVPAFAHAAFDFVALIYIARIPPRKTNL